jgi:TonB family protein
MTWSDLAIQSAWRGTFLLAVAFVTVSVLRNHSAAVRHFIWTAALAALLLLPALTALAPRWPVEAPMAANATPAASPAPSVVPSAVSTSRPAPSVPWWLWLWSAGCAVAVSRWLVGIARTRRLALKALPAEYAEVALERAAKALGIRQPVRVLLTAAVPVPMACGISRPTVLLPGSARDWPPARLETVLFHELSHIARHDLLSQAVAQAACCTYWFHPLVWSAARELRKEREHACDDAVLRMGIAPDQYAGDLMHMARALVAQRSLPVDAPAMAAVSDLEARVRSLFERGHNRRPLEWRTGCAIAAAALAVLLPVAGVTLHAQASRGALVGVVQDASGARIPDCRVNAKNQDGANQEMARCDNAGEFRFASIPPGRYSVDVLAPGFAKYNLEVTVTAGTVTRALAAMQIGAISGSLAIVGEKPAVAPRAAVPVRIPVGGNVHFARLVHSVKPDYPDELKQQGIEGTVVIHAVISVTGGVLNPKVVSTVDPRLAKLALDAVQQWSYEPVLLNGQPVEADTTITLEFALR